jgi:hypothetical protein
VWLSAEGAEQEAWRVRAERRHNRLNYDLNPAMSESVSDLEFVSAGDLAGREDRLAATQFVGVCFHA